MAVQNKPNFKTNEGNSWKKKGKAKDGISKPNPHVPKAGLPAHDECFQCKEKPNWMQGVFGILKGWRQ